MRLPHDSMLSHLLLAQKFLDTTYTPGKDYEKSEFRVDAWGTLSTRLYSFLTPDIVGCFAGSDFTAHDLYFADKPVFVFLSFHESDLLSMAPLIKFICESLMMELLNAYDDAPDEHETEKPADTLEHGRGRPHWHSQPAGTRQHGQRPQYFPLDERARPVAVQCRLRPGSDKKSLYQYPDAARVLPG